MAAVRNNFEGVPVCYMSVLGTRFKLRYDAQNVLSRLTYWDFKQVSVHFTILAIFKTRISIKFNLVRQLVFKLWRMTIRLKFFPTIWFTYFLYIETAASLTLTPGVTFSSHTYRTLIERNIIFIFTSWMMFRSEVNSLAHSATNF